MQYLQQSTSLLGSLKNAVLGNPVTREYHVGGHSASFGPGLIWKIFDGKRKSTGQDVSIFILEKSLLDKYDKKDREAILECMRHGPQQLTKLKHPRILTVDHPLEEARDSLAFATEPVFGSLSNVLGRHDNIPRPPPAQLQDFELFAVEKVYGLLQVAEGLAFLHNDANIIEGNITPESIVLTKGGQWKLAGFHYSVLTLNASPYGEYTTRAPAICRQNLNYLAPEHIFMQCRDFKSDMFSFGCLLSAVFNNLKTPFDAGDNITAYKKCLEQMSRLGSDQLHNVPQNVRDHVTLLLNVALEARPDANQTIKHEFFDDVAAMTLKYLDSLVQRDDMTKSQFFKNLHLVMSKLPKRVLHQRILPQLFSEFPNHMMIPFVLPNVFLIAEQCTNDEYMDLVFPELKKIFNITNPIQILLIFMQKMELMLKKTRVDEMKNFVLPLVFRALESPSAEIQELVLTIIPDFVHMVDYSSLRNAILPRIKVLITKSSSLTVRVNALVCVGKIIDSLDKSLLVDEIFPALVQIPSREPAILMAVLGIYKQALMHKKINLEKDYLATKAVPFLLPLAVEPTLSAPQFNNFMTVLRDMFDRIEQEHRTKLEQLQKMQEEQRTSIDFVKAANRVVGDDVMSQVDGLVIGKPSDAGRSKVADAELAKLFGFSNGPSSERKSDGLDLLTKNETANLYDHDRRKPSVQSSRLPQAPISPSSNLTSMSVSSSSYVPMGAGQLPSSGLPFRQSAGSMRSSTAGPSSRISAVPAQQTSINNLSSLNTPTVPFGQTSSNLLTSTPKDYSALDSLMAPEMSHFKPRQATNAPTMVTTSLVLQPQPGFVGSPLQPNVVHNQSLSLAAYGSSGQPYPAAPLLSMGITQQRHSLMGMNQQSMGMQMPRAYQSTESNSSPGAVLRPEGLCGIYNPAPNQANSDFSNCNDLLL